MRVHRTLHRILAAAALLTLIFASAATGGTWSRCRMTGVLLPVCCCPAEDAADGQMAPTSVEAGDCCERVITSVDQAPSEIAARDALAAPALVVAANDTAVGSARVENALRGGAEQSRAGPPTTRGVLLSKSSLLI